MNEESIEICKSLNFISFEGGDLSGKSTQAVEFAKSLPFAIIIHFPRKSEFDVFNLKKMHDNKEFIENIDSFYNVRRRVLEAFRQTEKVLYNDETYNEKLFTGDEDSFKSLSECCEENIIANAIDKVYSIKELSKTLYRVILVIKIIV